MKNLLLFIALSIVSCGPLTDPTPTPSDEGTLTILSDFCMAENTPCFTAPDEFNVDVLPFPYETEIPYYRNHLNGEYANITIDNNRDLVNTSFWRKDINNSANDDLCNIQIRYDNDLNQLLRNAFLAMCQGQEMPIAFYLKFQKQNLIADGHIDLLSNKLSEHGNYVNFSNADLVSIKAFARDEDIAHPNAYNLFTYTADIEFALLLQSFPTPNPNNYEFAVKAKRKFLVYFREDI